MGFVGGSVLLPCVYTQSLPVNVFWRDKNNNRVLNIDNNAVSRSPKYDGRVFATGYTTGNFSIIITNLTLDDAGTYKCIIDTEEDARRVFLRVTDEKPEENEKQKIPPPSGGAAGTNFLHFVLFSALSLLLCF